MLMSDGRSTTGVKDSRTIINALSAENAKGNSIFAFGGGKTVNHYLLDLLAYRNKGESFVTPRINDIDASIPRFFDRLKDPILMGLNANYGSVNTENVYPRELPDFFKGKAVEIYGRFDPVKDKELAMQLTGVAAAQKKEMILKANLSEAEKGDKTIAKGWAFQKIYHLIGEICRLGETPALLNQLRELSRQYGVKTSYDE
jgi:Ca-activated chloride channel family protein